MFGIVVASHGELAAAMVDTARLVLGELKEVVAVGIEEGDNAKAFEAKLQQIIDHMLASCPKILVLTDMFGGTPANIGLTMHQTGQVEVLTGVNLSMLLKALQLHDSPMDLSTVASRVKEAGMQAIASATEVLSRKVIKYKEISA